MDQRLSPPGCVEIAQRGVEIGAFAPPPAVDPASFEAAGEGVLSGGAGACRGSGTLDQSESHRAAKARTAQV